MPRYNPQDIEPRWQKYWEDNHTFKTPNKITGEKLYALDMFPYPSGEGLHVGHPEGYTATDIVARHARMMGKSVLHPMGFDAFGLPAEEYAIKTNTPPRVSTDKNIENFVRQLKMLGFSYDWERQVSTTDIDYVRWTQWIFTVLFDTWYDHESKTGRPIADLPIPEQIAAGGEDEVRRYQDEFRLAYETEALVNWCPGLRTVLANEEVIDGKSERDGHPVVRKPLRQWMLRITDYADRLEQDLDSVDWSEGIKKLQRDWIGRSTGAEVDFFIGGSGEFDAWKTTRSTEGFPRKPGPDVLRVYTTRPDTLFGATYMVIAPEHAAVESLTTDQQTDAVNAYVEMAAAKSDRDRQDDKTQKTGVFTGSYAINPINGKPVPIWIADYVLINYGTGAIMAVPAHDQRDFEFATKFGIEIAAVVAPDDSAEIDMSALSAGKCCFPGTGTAINSGQYDGQSTDNCKIAVTAQLTDDGVGQQAVNYKLRDWLFSRQRFWGEPFPILHEIDQEKFKSGVVEFTGAVRAVDAADLPVNLPDIEDYTAKPDGDGGEYQPPLDLADDSWLFPVIDGVTYKRETNTMPQWAGSCWYYLRFIDPKNDSAFIDPELEKQWMPVDLYIGGAEHAVLHLLYARFWHKVLFDRGHLQTKEPFQKLVNQGMILGDVEFTGYQNAQGNWVSAKDVKRDEEKKPIDQSGQALNAVKVEAEAVEKSGDAFVLKDETSIRIDSRAHKMSKSRGNVVTPDTIVQDYGADSLRLYEMFMGPLEQAKPWSMQGVGGVKNFLDRAWRMIVDSANEESLVLNPAVSEQDPTEDQTRMLHQTIKAVSNDIDNLSLNTAIARMMEFVNFFTKEKQRPKQIMESFVLLLSPFAPHIAEEFWRLLGHENSLAYEPWPKFDDALTKESTIEIPVQILGKIKSRIKVAPGTSKDDLEALALADEKIAQLLAEKTIVKTIVVPDRLVNFVAK